MRKLLHSIIWIVMVSLHGMAEISTVSPWHTAGNNTLTDFGGANYSVPNVELQHLTKAAFGTGPVTARMQIYALGFSDLQGVSYTGQAVGDVNILPVSGWTQGVSFYGFDLGVWQTPPLTRDVEYRIYNGDYSALLASGTVSVGALRTTVNTALFSPNGFHLQFESAGVVALDNYRVEGSDSAAPKPFIAVSGNGVGIPNGDTTPALLDHTDFGSGGGTRTFTITNSGPQTLNLTGTAPNMVTLVGSPDFSVTSQPATPVNANGGMTSFAITFTPSSAGVKSATVSIASDDTSKNPFTFRVSGYTASFSTGLMDTGFGTAGSVKTDLGSNANEYGSAVAVQADGKILVAGYSSTANSRFALARYSSEGALDATFGGGGFVLTDLGPSMDACTSIVLQTDGKILLAGYTSNGTKYNFAVVRYTATGALDNTFGTAGMVATSVGGGDDFANAMALQNDGKILVAGTSGNDFAVVRYTSGGVLDSSFGSGGKFVSTISSGSTDIAKAIAVQNDGRIVLAGGSLPSGGNFGFAALRCTSTGVLDPTFGSAGIVYTALRPSIDIANAVAVQQDGKILLGGYSNDSSTAEDFILVRYTSTGVLDSGFGSGGSVITAFGASYDFANSMGLQADGKIILAGSTHDFVTSDFAMARYTTAGALDTSFGAAGKVVNNVTSGQNDSANAMVVLPNGRIVLAGQAYSPATGIDFAVAVYGVPSPNIAVSQGSVLSDGGSVSLGATIPGMAGIPVTFTITNPGSADLSSLAVTKNGADVVDFIIGDLSATSIPVGGGTATFTVTFQPNATGTKTATLQIGSNVNGARNPFDLTLTAHSLSFNVDSDNDGLNDASELQMAAMGFNWQVNQSSLVSNYFNAAAASGYLTSAQLQAQNPGVSLIQKNPDTGAFTLTLGIEKSTTLQTGSFLHFPMTAPQTSVSEGAVLFSFPSVDPKAFYRLKAE